jgi:hypothetical protein
VTTGRQPQQDPTATLACGAVSEYEAPDLVPAAGDVVPCRKHGHCAVVRSARGGAGVRARAVVSRRRRSQAELVAYLEGRGSASLRALREVGFPLRLVSEAERAGHVHIDLLAGVVTHRPALRAAPASRHEPVTAA